MKPSGWICDTCGDEIDNPAGGLLVWRYVDKSENPARPATDFHIVHKGRCDRRELGGSHELSYVIGTEGQAWLLAFLTSGPLVGQPTSGVVELDEWVDVFRRLQTPWYEQARRNFQAEKVRAEYSDASEVLPYTPYSLEKIASMNDD
jgi:hypothetical protein